MAMSIGSTVASFEGGGSTPDGPRSGGLDGHGGFMSVLHPNEKITDLEQADTEAKSGFSANTDIRVNNYSNAEVETRRRREGNKEYIEFLIQQTKSSLAQDFLSGNGEVPTALGMSYAGLKRGAGVS
jgi:hypothetical protein